MEGQGSTQLMKGFPGNGGESFYLAFGIEGK